MNWRSTVNKYTLYGISFGFLFPVFSTLAEVWLKNNPISIANLIAVQQSSPLLWVIDTAPFFLGLFARIAGVKQESVERINSMLKKLNREMKIEITRSNTMEKSLKDILSVYKEDLSSARIIQEFSLPEIPLQPECRFYYKYLPLNPVGGDLLSITKQENNGFGVLVGDVVGHGISAALITSLITVISSETCRTFGLTPGKYLENLNEEAIHYLPENYFFTALYGYLKFENGTANFTFSRGGHPYPFVFSSSEKQTRICEIAGTPLGILKNLKYEELSIILNPGDRLFIITDGFLEAKDKNDKLLSNSGLSAIITEACTRKLSLEESIEYIINRIDDYSGYLPPEDDRLILGIEISA